MANPNPRPASREELKDFCLRQLGAPVINVYVDDDQVEDAVDNALQYFQDFHFDSVERWYLKHEITATDIANQYIPVTDNIIGVTRIFPFSIASKMSMFDMQYQMRLNDLYSFTSASFVYYVQMQQHLRTIDMLFNGEVPLRFNRHSDRLYIDWDWSVDAVEGQIIVIEGYIILDPNTSPAVYTDRLLKKLTTAYIKRQLGTNTKKYGQIPLPGGIVLNGKEWYDEAVEEIAEVEKLIRDTHEQPPNFLVGQDAILGTNLFFRNYSEARTNEQLLFEDILVESIQITGHDIYYLPRESWDETDQLFGENVNSKFERAYQMEMYIMDTQQFTGDQDFFSKMGLEIRDNSNFQVARRTFEKYVPTTVRRRPREGDLLWVPVMNRLFEIKFIEEENFHFTLGNKMPYLYEMRCELFRYSSETIDTGIDAIDDVQSDSSYTIQMTVSGEGDFHIGETVYQGANLSAATMTATVSEWDNANNALYLVDIAGDLSSNASLTGITSNTIYTVTLIDTFGDYVWWDSWDNKIIQDEANTFVNLSEINPFGLF